MARSKTKKANGNGANLGFEEKLWATADKLRGHMDAAEYKHVVLGLIFLKYISDAFQERYDQLKADKYADPEDRDEYAAENVFWVPKPARWSHLQAGAKKPTIGRLIDDAMVAIEKENSTLKGVLPKDYGRASLDKQRLGELIDLVGTIGLGDRESRSQDILGRVYEYFLGRFASAEGKGGGEFYTPQSVVKLLVEMIEPYKGRIYDPCCGSGGMFVQSEKFVLAHGGRVGDLSIYGQESNNTTWRLCKMNLAIRGIEGNLGPQNADAFHSDLHKDLKADFILANPPFNVSDWGGDRLREDARWKHGTPPAGNANFAWVQHMVHHLAPSGIAGFVLANGSMSSNQSGEGEIRKALVEADLVDCMIAMPGQLFYTTQIPVCLWFLSRSKKNGKFRDRRGDTLFIDARKLGVLRDRIHRDLPDEEIARIAKTYHAWRGEKDAGKYKDAAGFCKSTTTDEIVSHGHVLTPGRYVGAEEQEDDGEDFDAKMKRLTATLAGQFKESAKLEKAILKNLAGLGFSPRGAAMTDQLSIPADDPPGGQILIYRDGAATLHVRLDGRTVWLPQRQIADLFQVTVPNVNQHLKTIYEDGELQPEATIKQYLIVQTEGSRRVSRLVNHYNLNAILAVGYRVRSPIGTRFRQWATARLNELVVKGFTLDDERIKAGRTLGDDYFEELLARIRDIRASERMFYQKITDIYATSIDYDADAEVTKTFFQTVQNKMHWAAHGHTAAEIVRSRANAAQPHMGLTTWKNGPAGPVRKADISVAKNYLDHEELDDLNRIASAYLEFAELQAKNRRPMHMADWIAKLDDFLKLSERDILTHLGKISHTDAEAHAQAEFAKFETERQRLETTQPTSDFDKAVENIRKLGQEGKRLPQKMVKKKPVKRKPRPPNSAEDA